MYCNKDGLPVLQGDGSYGFTVLVDGQDLVVRNARATWFGGDDDPDDNGDTASGVSTQGHPDLDGCALPMDGFGLLRTQGSPLPRIPWQTTVRVYNRANQATVEVPLIDVGPAKPPWAHAQLDLTRHTFTALGGSLADGDLAVDYRVLGAAASLGAEAKAAIASLPTSTALEADARYSVVWLRGDYVDHHDRQEQAGDAGCVLAIDFHFNQFDDANARGAEVWHKPGDDKSYRFALAVKEVYTTLGLPPHGDEVVKQATASTTSGFIRHYPCSAVLLEPLFISNRAQASWIHNHAHLLAFGAGLVAAIKEVFPGGGLIGLSIGHRGKRNDIDTGARCCLGDTEADHAADLAHVVAELLSQ